MTDQRREEPDKNHGPVPRDLPDQQAHVGEEDPWEVAAREGGETREADEGAGPDTDVPDTDEAGTGRQGSPHAATVHPEHPAPDESTG